VAAVSDAFPERLSLEGPREYVALLQLRSEDPKALEAYAAAAGKGAAGQAAGLVFEVALAKDAQVPLALYTSLPAAATDTGALTGARTLRLAAGATGRYFVAAPGAGALLAEAGGASSSSKSPLPMPPHEARGHLLLDDYAQATAATGRAPPALKPGQRAAVGLQAGGAGGSSSDPHRVAHRDPAGTPVTLTLPVPAAAAAKGVSGGGGRGGGGSSSSAAPLPEALWAAALAHLGSPGAPDPWAPGSGSGGFDALVQQLLAGCNGSFGGAVASAVGLQLAAPAGVPAAESRLAVLLSAMRRKDDALGSVSAGTSLGLPVPQPPVAATLGTAGRLLGLQHAAVAATAANGSSTAAAAAVASAVASCAAVLGAVDAAAVAAHYGTLRGADAAAALDFGTAPDANDAAAGAASAGGSGAGPGPGSGVDAAMATAKEALVEAAWRAARLQLQAIGAAVLGTPLPPPAAAAAGVDPALALPAAAALLRSWAAKTDPRHGVLALEAALRAGRPGLALKHLRALQGPGEGGGEPALAPEVQHRLWGHCLYGLRWDAPLAAAAPPEKVRVAARE